MMIGEAGAVTALWEAARDRLPRPREDRPGQPVYAIERAAAAGETGLRAATPADFDRLLPACAAAHRARAGHRPARPRPRGVPLAHLGADRRGPLLALARGRRRPLQGRGVRLDAVGGADPAGLGRPRGARPAATAPRGLRDLCRLLLASTPAVVLFVRSENAPAIAALRFDRHASSARVPEHPLLSLGRLLRIAARVWLAALGRRRAGRLRGPPSGGPRARRRSIRRIRPAGCPAPNEGSGRDRNRPDSGSAVFRMGLIAAVLLTCSGVLLVVGRSAHAADANKIHHVCSATDKQFIDVARANLASVRLWGNDFFHGGGSAADVVAATKDARVALDGTSPSDPSLRDRQALLPLDVHRVRPGREGQGSGARRLRPHVPRVQPRRVRGPRALERAAPSCARSGCDVSELL